MKNLIVANFSKNVKKHDELKKLIHAQIFNSKSFGWSNEDFIIISNIDKICDFGNWIKTNLNEKAFTASKLFAVKYIYENNITNDSLWAHDLDAWQNSEFEEPEFLDVGFCHYSRPKINGGSQFWKISGLDILNYVIKLIQDSSSEKEEPCLDKTYKQYSNRITILNNRYNVGCSGFVERYERSIKPIQVCHLHPTNRIAWQTHCLDRNGMHYKSVSLKLENNLRKFYSLQDELDEEGKIAREYKINRRNSRK